MKIELQQIKTGFTGEFCYTHARAGMSPEGRVWLTTQPLLLEGCDIFYGMQTLVSSDRGRTFSGFRKSAALIRQVVEGGMEDAFCDATPLFCKKSGKTILLGHTARYLNNKLAPNPRRRFTAWSVWDEAAGDWTPYRHLEMPDTEAFYSCGNGCGQSYELPDGDLLIPVYNASLEESRKVDGCYAAMVLRCGFDGENLWVKELGSPLQCPVPRGFCEPSITAYGGNYFLALRNDVTGYVARSSDGMHYSDPVELSFDDGENAGNYNTQQHWITGGGKLYMVYTRRGAGNDHVFRHRAPLFIAEFDPEKMVLIRSTEQIAVPERGARLGNFGCLHVSDHESWVIASEWMQTTAPDHYNYRRCMSYGSDNSIFIARITWSE